MLEQLRAIRTALAHGQVQKAVDGINALEESVRGSRTRGALPVRMEYPDGADEYMTLDCAAAQINTAIEDDYRDDRWGRIYAESGAQIGVIITVEPGEVAALPARDDAA